MIFNFETTFKITNHFNIIVFNKFKFQPRLQLVLHYMIYSFTFIYFYYFIYVIKTNVAIKHALDIMTKIYLRQETTKNERDYMQKSYYFAMSYTGEQ